MRNESSWFGSINNEVKGKTDMLYSEKGEVLAHTCNHSTQEAEEEDCQEFKTSMKYMVNSRLGGYCVRPCSKTTQNKRNDQT